MKTLRAFWLGFIEHDEMYGTPMDSFPEILIYERGRRLGQLLSFQRPTR